VARLTGTEAAMIGDDTYEYLTYRIKVLEGQRRELMEELRKVTSGVYLPLVSETDAEKIFMIHECPKCGLQTLLKRTPAG
jgi:hypothetical protein